MVHTLHLHKGLAKLQKLYCPRLDHFVRFNANGTIGKCGHMMNAPGFGTWNDMQNSDWLKSVKQQMSNDQWPVECRRCQQTEQLNPPHSIRLASIDKHRELSVYSNDYLILGGVLDNICNSACQSCSSKLSTKIGSLTGKNYIKVDNSNLFDSLPLDRAVEIDLNGGEPTASPEYQKLLNNLPASVKLLRVNTNGSRLLPGITKILDKGIKVIITLSLDGVGQVHDYVRWPIKWNKYTSVVAEYQRLAEQYTNLILEAWTTVHALNINDFDNIQMFAEHNNLGHSWAFLSSPEPLNVVYKNNFTNRAKHNLQNSDVVSQIALNQNNQSELDNFIKTQDNLRSININDYLNY